MIKYSLICRHDHIFEAWFSSCADYDTQRKARLINARIAARIRWIRRLWRRIFPPRRKKEKTAENHKNALAIIHKVAEKISHEIVNQSDYVGDDFADEARAIHYGEKAERGIYGQTTAAQAAELQDEGVAITRLPGAIAPKPKKTLN